MNRPTSRYFWVNCRRYEASSQKMTGAEIRAIANTAVNEPLIRDLNAAVPHKPPNEVYVGDGEVVDLDGEPHFFTVPPATMYRGNEG